MTRLIGCTLLGAGEVPQPAIAPPPFQLLRYNEDYDYLANEPASQLTPWEELKYIPIGSSAGKDLIASLGGEVRYQYIERWDDQFGRIEGAYGSLQQRYLLHLNAVFSQHFRFFGQLISAWEKGKKPGPLPVDVDHLDAQELFLETWLNSQRPGEDYFRVGRQEILLGNHQLLKVRDGPNVPLAFDAARLHFTSDAFAADAFAGNVVQPTPGVFEDKWLDRTMTFSGANIGWQMPADGFHSDIFWFDYRNRFVRYQNAAGPEDRQTIGIRLDGHRGPWVFDYEASEQFGTLGSLEIQAWGTALFTTRHWDETPWQPAFTLGFSYVTGDRDRTGRLNTFNCLFARGDYFGDTDLLTGSNTVDLSGRVGVAPMAAVNLTTQWDLLWRSETTDGLYAPPLIFIINGRTSDARFIGNQLTETLSWSINRMATIQVIGSVLVAGAFLEAATPGKNTAGLTARTQFKF